MTPDRLGGALLLAAGRGSRLRPLTDVLPKCLAPIRGRPLLEYWILELMRFGIETIVINTHHHAELVEYYLERGPWANSVIVSREEELLGTGGTLVANEKHFDNGPLLVAHADNLSLFDIGAFAAAHQQRPPEAVVTMMTFTTSTPESCGIITTNAQGIVDGFHEKVANPPGNRANGAVYIFEPEVTRFAAGLGKRCVDLSTEVLPHYVRRMYTWHNDRYHRDIGSLCSWRMAQRDFSGPVPVDPVPDPWRAILDSRAPGAADAISRLLASDSA